MINDEGPDDRGARHGDDHLTAVEQRPHRRHVFVFHRRNRLARGGDVRIEEIENPLTQQARYLDKLVDELAKGRKMEKILRTE